MRRNLLYRKRYFIATFLEFALPVLFAGLLLLIKDLADDSTPEFLAQTVDAKFYDHFDTKKILTFNDYVTAMVAKRECVARRDAVDKFTITGLPRDGYDWQVPFVKCDSRRCQKDGEEAYGYCVYPILALAPQDENDQAGIQRVQDFHTYIGERYPQLQDTNLTHFPNGYDFVQTFPSSSAIDKYIKSGDYGITGKEQIGLAVVFDGNDPLNFQYSIRANSTNFNAPEKEARPGTSTSPDTSRLFSSFAKTDNACSPLGGTPTQGAMQNSCTGQYIYNGYLATQRLVQDWIMEASGAKDAGYFVSEQGVRYVQFPARAYEDKGFYGELATFMPLLMTLGILYPCAAMLSYVVQEKELRQKELMKMMGVLELEIGLSWFFSFWSLHFFTATVVTIISISLFENSDGIYLFLFWQLCFLAFVVFSQFMSTFVSKTTRGVLLGLLAVFGGYFLTELEDVVDGRGSIITLISIHPVAAMAYALQEVGRLEDLGVGLNAASITVTDSPSNYTFTNAFGNLIFSILFLGFFTWYFNRVIKPAYGQALPLYFPFARDYWCPNRTKHIENENENDKIKAAEVDESIPLEPVSDLLHKQAKEGKNVEIRNLKKDFGDKVAVDGLNLSMYNNQITALLGKNGAGKTTTIGMLTGAFSPTEGTAVVCGKDIRTEMSAIRGDIGICLQHDCLFPKLTVREHLQFFSRVKGTYGKLLFEEAEVGIDQAIRDVALEEKSNTFSSNLSGGMQRKLSLAIAFCGGSKVVFLDEPTSGMDPFSRRFSWNVIRQYRQDRCIVLTTHFMEEADILGDRIAIMAEGRLRCCGSSLFLKKNYGVGYQLTIEKPFKKKDDAFLEDTLDEDLQQIVVGAVDKATLLSNVGTEMSFQLPLGASDKFVPMLQQLDEKIETKEIRNYGVSITTLNSVFLLVARGEEQDKKDYESSRSSSNIVARAEVDDEKSVKSKMDLDNENLFLTHVQALLRKRASNFKRDKKAWCCTTILPSLFVLCGLILLQVVGPNRNLEVLDLHTSFAQYNVGVIQGPNQNPILFNAPQSFFSCNPGRCTTKSSIAINQTNETYYFCGGPAMSSTPGQNCSINESEVIVQKIIEAGATEVGGEVTTINESSHFIFDMLDTSPASQYGGIFFTHESGSTTQSGETYGEQVSGNCSADRGDYLSESECARYGTGTGYAIAYNFTALHVAPLFQMLADQSIIRHALGEMTFKLSAVIHPLPITNIEESFGAADDAFVLWFLVVLSFPFIAGAFGTFVVTERQSKARHLQTVTGVSPTAYWLSTLIWDFSNYLIPFLLTVVLLYAFDATIFTTNQRNVVSGVMCLLLFFGPAAASMAYCFSFLFKSPSLCNVTIIISGFLIGMGGAIASLVLNFIGLNPFEPRPTLVNVATGIDWVGRLFPSFCLGKGLLYAINIEAFEFIYGRKLDAWDPEILLIEVIYLAAESIVYFVLAVYIDILSSNPEVMLFWHKYFCCQRSSENSLVASIPDDDDVIAEQQRVLRGEANDDVIVLSELTKIYQNGKVAVNKLSFGVPPGECFALLGINGAGKTTTMGMLTAEFPPTAGDATLAGFSLRREPEKTRRRIGYCPQFDAHFELMTGREHVELYASIKGVPKASVKEAAAAKLHEVGLNAADSDRLCTNYSGGMKRRLSLACATIGQPDLVFLDECSTGVDPVARREIWQMVSNMVSGGTSVVLTTHSMEEAEALCPRIGIMANGKLRCIGSAQHLKTKFGQGYQLELKVAAVSSNDEDYKTTQATLVGRKAAGASTSPDEEAVSSETETSFNLQEAEEALQHLTGDDYLSSMLNASNPIGYSSLREASSPIGISLTNLTSFAYSELRVRDLNTFVESTYPSAILRERQGMMARFEVSSQNMSIASIFASIEENKQRLHLTEYSVGQSTLEDVFNLHAKEAEELKQGRMDG